MPIVPFARRVVSWISSKIPSYPVESTQREKEIMDECKPFTMTSSARLWATISSSKYVLNNNIRGAFVECGVWRGGSAMAMAKIATLLHCDRDIYLFDTFEGMTKPSSFDKDRSGESAGSLLDKTKKSDGNSVWCIASINDVKSNIAGTCYPSEKVHYIKGDVCATLEDATNLPAEISLLRLDTDWYESTKKELEVLFPRLSKGGVCLIDDYGHWQGAKKAVDEYLNEQGIVPLLHVTDYTGRAFIKP